MSWDMSFNPLGLNFTDPNFDPKVSCTIDVCPLELGHLQYRPTRGGNGFYAGAFAILLLIQLFLGIKHKTWGYLVGMGFGLLGEVIGYIGRVMMYGNPFDDVPFLTELVSLTIAPALITAAIYLCLARIITIYGRDVSRLRPATYTVLFMTFDFISLLLQAIGGAMASSGKTPSDVQTGVNTMIGGLSFQVVSLFIFIVLCSDFAYCVCKSNSLNPEHATVRNSTKFKGFIFALAVATIAIFARSTFRVAELQGGFHGALANNEVLFMILEGALLVIAGTSLTAFHPGVVCGQAWEASNFKIRDIGLNKRNYTEKSSDSSSGSLSDERV